MSIDEKQLYQLIGRNLKQRREALGWSQAQAGGEVGLLRTSITNIEAGRQKLPLHVLYKLCAAMDIEPTKVLPLTIEVTAEAAASTPAAKVPFEEFGDTEGALPKTAGVIKKWIKKNKVR